MNFRIGKFFKQSNAVFLFEYKRYHSRIAIAMSGGIDSSAVAMILKDQGYECHGIYMKNWDVVDELESACTNEINYNHMVKVCERLQIPAYKVEFIKEYWTDVFIPYLESYQSGEKTPNPDVFCNRFIKFNYFKKFVKEKLDIDVIATGHYANVKTVIINGKQTVRLLKGNDASKDQSYFLSMTPASGLNNVLFPLGMLKKSEVRNLVQERFAGLEVLTKPESMGICFIGKRSLPDFLGNYMTFKHGRFVDVDTGRIVGAHNGVEMYTIGQGASIAGAKRKYFIASRNPCFDVMATIRRNFDSLHTDDELSKKASSQERYSYREGDVFVAMGSDHPALYADFLTIKASEFNWVTNQIPMILLLDLLRSCLDEAGGSNERSLYDLIQMIHCIDGSYSKCITRYKCKPRYRTSDVNCTIHFQLRDKSSFKCDQQTDTLLTNLVIEVQNHMQYQQAYDADALRGCYLNRSTIMSELLNRFDMIIRFEEPQFAISPGQILAIYDHDECLGGGVIQYSHGKFGMI